MKISELYGNLDHSFTEKLINWYEQNERELPWRETKDPYNIWMSEIILQQTRVDQGLPYYLKFVEAYPTIRELAKASEDEVMKLWQGLGYYSRCRNLHYTAKHVWYKLNGRFPNTYQELLKLKGIGPYTAAAISSICFGEIRAVVDGNVDRFVSRYFGVDCPVNNSEGKKLINQITTTHLLSSDPGKYNQAIMEFGATVCKPQQPICDACIFSNSCYAYKNNCTEQLPVKIKKQKPTPRYFDYLVFVQNDETFIRQRNDEDIWKGLYEFFLLEHDQTNMDVVFDKIIPGYSKVIGERIYLKHILTHRIIHASFTLVEIGDKSQIRESGIWVSFDGLEDYPVSRLIDKFISNHLAKIVEYSKN